MIHVARMLGFALLWLVLGCASPAERAEKLFEDGKYEEVLARYPQEPAADKARDALAAKLLKEGQYQRVFTEFKGSPLAVEARVRYAEELLKAGKHEEVLSDFADTPAAIMAREMAAQTLYDAGRISEAAREYPQTPAGSRARDELARAEYERIMTFRSPDERRKALEAFITSSTFAGTTSFAQAQLELARLDGLKLPGNY
ncbi:MAG: hypothetical protein IPK53_00250 [bacterium]|nr:hypothetical protein [bacterium]MBK8127395.1 hypothetical protein [bacterium]